MKAIIKSKKGPGLEMINDHPMPTINENDVLVKIKKTSICGTDLHIEKWDDWAQKTINPPLVIGHEFIGEVIEVGKNVKNIFIGERVTAEGHLVCNECIYCRSEKRHYCPETKGIGYNCQGVFSEYASIPSFNIWKANKLISDEELVCFDPFGNAIHTALSYNLLGKNVIIAGAGPIGCMAAAIARYSGANKIVVTDVNDFRLNIAKKMGADIILNINNNNFISNSNIADYLGINFGFDVGLEMSGSIFALKQIIDSMSNGGKIALLGIIPNTLTYFDWNKIIFKQLILKGIYGRKIFDTWYKGNQLIINGLNIKPVITHIFDHIDYQNAFSLMKTGLCGKIVLNWE